MLKNLTIAATLLLVCIACEREDQLLLGNWRGSLVTENGDSLRLNPSEITFYFGADNRYRFTSTLRYQEAGTWRYDNRYLFARDTTQPTNPERVVAIEKLTVDSLVLKMRSDTAERLVTLLRDSLAMPQ